MAIGDEPIVGEIFAEKWRIEELLGAGGMGAVYRATQIALDMPVAIKVIRSKHLGEEAWKRYAARFKREAAFTSKLRHPNAVRVHDFGETAQGVLYLVLEHVAGQTLKEVIERDSPMKSARVAQIGVQLCHVLAEAHAKGIIHRDLKPANVMVSEVSGRRDFVRLLDFGIAKMTMSDASVLTEEGQPIGTLLYMAPEQIKAEEVTPQTDLYALGCLLFEMLSGAPPYIGETPSSVLYAHLEDPVPAIRWDGELTDEAARWNALLRRAMAKQAASRHESADVLASELQALVDAPESQPEGPLAGVDPSILSEPSESSGHSLTLTLDGHPAPRTPSLEEKDKEATEDQVSYAFARSDTLPGSEQEVPVSSLETSVPPSEVPDPEVFESQARRTEPRGDVPATPAVVPTSTSPVRTLVRPRNLREVPTWWRENWPELLRWLFVTAATGAVLWTSQQVLSEWNAEPQVVTAQESRAVLAKFYREEHWPEPPTTFQSQDESLLQVLSAASATLKDAPGKARQSLIDREESGRTNAEYWLLRALSSCRAEKACGSPMRPGSRLSESKRDEVLAHTKRALEICPDCGQVHLVEGMVRQASNPQGDRLDHGGLVRRSYERALGEAGLDSTVKVRLMLELAHMNTLDAKYEAAKLWLDKLARVVTSLEAAESMPVGAARDIAEFYFESAHLAAKTKAWSACKVEIQEAITQDPEVATYHWWKGRCLHKLDEADASKQSYCEAWKLSEKAKALSETRPLERLSGRLAKKAKAACDATN